MSWHRKSSDRTEHEYVETRLSAYLDGELPPQERAAVDRHLATCQACQWNLETLHQTVQWTRELPPVPVPRVFTVPAPAEPARARRRRWSFLPLLQGATALVALLLVFVVGGDVLLSGLQLASAPAPGVMREEAPSDVQVVERVEKEAEVIVEVQAVEATAPVEMEKAAAPQSEPSLPPQEEPASAPPGAGQEETLVAGGETGMAGGEAAEAEGKGATSEAAPMAMLAVTVTQTYTPTRFFTTERSAEPTATVNAFGVRAPTPAPLPTQAPTAEPAAVQPTAAAEPPPAPPPPPRPTALPVLPPTVAPTVVAEAREGRELLALDEGRQSVSEQTASRQTVSERQAPFVTWFRTAEITLGVMLVLLALLTVGVMIARRRA